MPTRCAPADRCYSGDFIGGTVRVVKEDDFKEHAKYRSRHRTTLAPHRRCRGSAPRSLAGTSASPLRSPPHRLSANQQRLRLALEVSAGAAPINGRGRQITERLAEVGPRLANPPSQQHALP